MRVNVKFIKRIICTLPKRATCQKTISMRQSLYIISDHNDVEDAFNSIPIKLNNSQTGGSATLAPPIYEQHD